MRARNRLRAITRFAPLSLREIADIIGVEYQTLFNHLTPGRKIARARERWYHRLQSIEVNGDVVTITLRYVPTRKRANFLLERAQWRIKTPPDRVERRVTDRQLVD